MDEELRELTRGRAEKPDDREVARHYVATRLRSGEPCDQALHDAMIVAPRIVILVPTHAEGHYRAVAKCPQCPWIQADGPRLEGEALRVLLAKISELSHASRIRFVGDPAALFPLPPEVCDYSWPPGPLGPPREPHPTEEGTTPRHRARMKAHENVRRRPPRRI